MTQQTERIDIAATAAKIDKQLSALPADAKTADIRAVRRQFSQRLATVVAPDVIALGQRHKLTTGLKNPRRP